jgi:hypothetical protein
LVRTESKINPILKSNDLVRIMSIRSLVNINEVVKNI